MLQNDRSIISNILFDEKRCEMIEEYLSSYSRSSRCLRSKICIQPRVCINSRIFSFKGAPAYEVSYVKPRAAHRAACGRFVKNLSDWSCIKCIPSLLTRRTNSSAQHETSRSARDCGETHGLDKLSFCNATAHRSTDGNAYYHRRKLSVLYCCKIYTRCEI